MKNETLIYILSSLVLVGVCFAFFMMSIDREIERQELQTQSWKDQGYPIGEYRVVENQIQL